MKMSAVMQGMEILNKYFLASNHGYNLGADHDIIYVYVTDNPVSLEDINLLRDIGWAQDTEEYSQSESWHAYV